MFHSRGQDWAVALVMTMAKFKVFAMAQDWAVALVMTLAKFKVLAMEQDRAVSLVKFKVLKQYL